MSEGASIYFDKLRQHFLQAFNERESRERALTPETFDEFSAADEACTRSAVKLLEAGAKARVEDDLILIDAGERECGIYKEKVIEIMGKDEFYDFFPDLIETSIVDGDDEECTVEPDTSEEPALEEEEAAGDATANTPPPANPFADPNMAQAMQANPFYAFMQMMLAPFMGNMQGQQMPQIPQMTTAPAPEVKEPEKPTPEPAKGKEILDSTISDIQGKTERLEKEKQNAEKSFKVILEKSKRLESELNRRTKAQNEAEAKFGELSAERDAAVKALNSETSKREKLAKEIESLKQEVTSIKESSEKAVNDERAKTDEMFKAANDAKTRIAELEEQIRAKERQISESKNQSNNLRSQIDNLKAQLAKAQETSPELEVLRKKVADTESELERVRGQVESAKKDAESLRSENKKWQSEADRMRGEINTLKSKASEVNEGLIKSTKEENESLKAQIETLSKASEDKDKEIARLQSVAFTDSQTGLLNTNSLNNDLRGYNVREITMAQVNICGVRDINLKYGKKMGDTLIRKVASKVSERFPNDKIYRVLGDNFIIISRNKVEDFRASINALKKSLKEEEVEIAATVCDGSKHSAIPELIAECENTLNQQRMYGSFDDEPEEAEAEAKPAIAGVEEVTDNVPTETSFNNDDEYDDDDDDDDTDVDDSELD